MTYEYRARVVRWIDGDTIVVDIDQGFHDWKTDQHLRLYGIDAPDIQPAKGEATAYVRGLVPDGSEVVIRTHKDEGDKYGRWLCQVWPGGGAGLSVNDRLVLDGHAKAWNGQGPRPVMRQGVCGCGAEFTARRGVKTICGFCGLNHPEEKA